MKEEGTTTSVEVKSSGKPAPSEEDSRVNRRSLRVMIGERMREVERTLPVSHSPVFNTQTSSAAYYLSYVVSLSI